MMRTSDAGIFALALHEGIVPAPYLDSVNVWTYGIGHTAAAGAPDPAQMPRGNPADLERALARVFEVFRADLPKYEAEVRAAVKVPLRQHEFEMQATPQGWRQFCKAQSNPILYQPDSVLDQPVTLDWWTDGKCAILPEGRTRIMTTWAPLARGLEPVTFTSEVAG
jgi:hypothetical protein